MLCARAMSHADGLSKTLVPQKVLLLMRAIELLIDTIGFVVDHAWQCFTVALLFVVSLLIMGCADMGDEQTTDPDQIEETVEEAADEIEKAADEKADAAEEQADDAERAARDADETEDTEETESEGDE